MGAARNDATPGAVQAPNPWVPTPGPNAPLALTSEWQTFEIYWPSVQPGNQVFDPRDLFGIHYQAYDVFFPAQSPINFDFCIDDIELF